MSEFLRVFDRQVEQDAAAENEHVAEVKAELLPAIERAKAKRAGLKAAWAKRNELVSELNSHIYPGGFPQSAALYLNELNMSAVGRDTQRLRKHQLFAN
jgi:kynurenine formamidase